MHLMRASRKSHGNLGSNVTVEGGNQSVTIFGITVSNTSAANVEVTFSDNDGAEIESISCPAEDSRSNDICWLADNGIKADSLNSSVKVTVFHSSPGA